MHYHQQERQPTWGRDDDVDRRLTNRTSTLLRCPAPSDSLTASSERHGYPDREEAHAEGSHAVVSKLILHVDDEPQIRELFRDALLDEGHRVTSVASASEALKVLATETPDLIISDFHLADSDGLGLIRAVKAKLPTTPVVLLTGALIDTRVADMAMGDLIDTCLSKTSPLDQILSEITRLLGK
jgi:CheY-like chemotaxis protein